MPQDENTPVPAQAMDPQQINLGEWKETKTRTRDSAFGPVKPDRAVKKQASGPRMVLSTLYESSQKETRALKSKVESLHKEVEDLKEQLETAEFELLCNSRETPLDVENATFTHNGVVMTVSQAIESYRLVLSEAMVRFNAKDQQIEELQAKAERVEELESTLAELSLLRTVEKVDLQVRQDIHWETCYNVLKYELTRLENLREQEKRDWATLQALSDQEIAEGRARIAELEKQVLQAVPVANEIVERGEDLAPRLDSPRAGGH